MYVAKFSEKIYVLHAFQKKTQKTNKNDINIAKTRYKAMRGVAIFAKACFGHPSPSKQQKLNATANAFGAPDVLRTCHFATTIVNSVLAS
jgi:hypothetical protein